MLAPLLWDSVAHESGNFFSKCWRTWWKVNFEFVGACVKHGLRSRERLQDDMEKWEREEMLLV